jgi:hypothetical protein
VRLALGVHHLMGHLINITTTNFEFEQTGICRPPVTGGWINMKSLTLNLIQI